VRRSARYEDIMDKHIVKHVVAAVAAALTTASLFSAVVSIAADDKAALLAAQTKPMLATTSRYQ